MRRIPLAAKVLYTAFMAVLVPYYWHEYTPWNFLYFCDVALILTLVAIWTESRFLVSLSAVGIMLPQTVWVADFLARLTMGVHLTGMTGYMFDADIPLFVRGLSSFHGWLPFVLVWLLVRLGYDRRAIHVQAPLAIGLLLVCYAFGPIGPAAGNEAVNINYVFGMDDAAPQTTMAPLAWLGLMMVVNVFAFQVPTHLVLQRLIGLRARADAPAALIAPPAASHRRPARSPRLDWRRLLAGDYRY